MPVGSPTMQPAGLMPRATTSAIRRRTPMQPTSSSYDSAKCSGRVSPRRRNSGTNARPIAGKLFMSVDAAAVQPVADERRVERSGIPRLAVDRHDVGMSGKHDAARVALPSRAGSVANRFALRRSSSKVSASRCRGRRDSRAPSRSARGWIRGWSYRSRSASGSRSSMPIELGTIGWARRGRSCSDGFDVPQRTG